MVTARRRSDVLARALLRKFNLTESDVKILTVGGTGQVEPFNAMRGALAEAALVTPPCAPPGRLQPRLPT